MLHLLTDEQPTWTVDDLARDADNAEDARSAVKELLAAGLVAQTGATPCFATRATVRLVELIGDQAWRSIRSKDAALLAD